ncbi:isopentenyl-diphosphate Delta-isomerase [Auraticoccus sp. F435]|uniref:Isopentenyl-diphosphate Delta-isomerase n=1 Tax=Auraticoccus cholistanensis TaxID=2656650 RepID=A0A6A9UR71_9ACTN|nr:isopentenyl-diphosphate Delta-isomerase [Auraticoccus cholistanensis]MVA75243.1 isopentenyl-diphosphate Delta-isomerase [Auraticoccus cholistanensis]
MTDAVVLVDPEGHAIGQAPRATVHDSDTPLHLAFSLHLLDDRDRVLLTRRALTKRTWPGVWTNSCCGHPRPDEPLEVAVVRRVREELGVGVTALECLLPRFRYRAVDASGMVENELCPVFVARVDGEVLADPDEVAEWTWVDWADLVRAITAVPAAFSPWAAKAVPELTAAGFGPGRPPAPGPAAPAAGGAGG